MKRQVLEVDNESCRTHSQQENFADWDMYYRWIRITSTYTSIILGALGYRIAGHTSSMAMNKY